MRLDEVVLVYFVFLAAVATLATVFERDVLKAVVKSSLQSLALAMTLVVLQAPELVLVYLPIGVGAYTVIFVTALGRMPRYEGRRESRSTLVAAAFTLAFLSVALLSAILLLNITGGAPAEEIKELGGRYLSIAYNSTAREWWSGESRVVVSILWDYRGADTLFEITVLSLAIIVSIVSFGLFKTRVKPGIEAELSLLSKVSVKMVSALTIVVSLALLLAEHVPGGGFQSGVTTAIAPAILIAAFSGLYFERLGFREWRLATGLILGLAGLMLVALAPVALGGAALQNQAKPWTGFEGFSIDLIVIHVKTSIKLYDILEAVVVASGFSLAFLLLTAPREVLAAIKRRVRSQ